MLVGVSIGRVNREMVFRPFFMVLLAKPEEKPLPAMRRRKGVVSSPYIKPASLPWRPPLLGRNASSNLLQFKFITRPYFWLDWYLLSMPPASYLFSGVRGVRPSGNSRVERGQDLVQFRCVWSRNDKGSDAIRVGPNYCLFRTEQTFDTDAIAGPAGIDSSATSPARF